MGPLTTSAHVAGRPDLRPRPWRAARITPLAELLQPGRLAATAIRLVTQIVLVAALWSALYTTKGTSAGFDRDQAVTYAVLAVLITSVRTLDRQAGRDTVLLHVATGNIVYWLLRPVPPWKYHLIRTVGDQAYGLLWASGGYLACLGTGLIDAPASPAAGAVSAVSLLLGQVILYELTLATDLLCFWTVMNTNAVRVLQFIQDLLSGAFAPLWFFPDWVVTLSYFLPFQGVLNVPLSLYVGRLPASAAPVQLLIQLAWCAALAVGMRALWRSAAARITVQGG
ncbi:ABC transporter permease [Streptomyces sp. SS8]